MQSCRVSAILCVQVHAVLEQNLDSGGSVVLFYYISFVLDQELRSLLLARLHDVRYTGVRCVPSIVLT